MKALAWIGGIFFGLVLALACPGAQEPLFEGLGSYTRTIVTSSPEAQRYFDQGLAFLHGFNHGAAIRSFQTVWFKADVRITSSCLCQLGLSSTAKNSSKREPELQLLVRLATEYGSEFQFVLTQNCI